MRRQCTSNICKRNSVVLCRNVVHWQHCYITGPIRFCSKICNVGGRMISAPTRSVPLNHRAVIWWHTPCRGGYQPPGCFPNGETTSAHCADNAVSNICKRNSTVQYRNMVYYQYCDIIWPIRFCSKTCNVGGRMISAPTDSVVGGRMPPNYQAVISGRS